MKNFCVKLKKNMTFRLVITGLFCVLCAILLPLTKVNYDNSKYLPDDSETAQGLTIMYDEFGEYGSAQIMLKDISITKAAEFKEKVLQIENVKSMVWINDIVLPYLPPETTEDMFYANYDTFILSLPEQVQLQLQNYYNGNALYDITFNDPDYHQNTINAIKQIDSLDNVYIRGAAASAYNGVNVIGGETFKASLIIVPVIILILLLVTSSFLEPLIFLVIIGVSVLLNMGTNIIFGEISYMTLATASILQLALSMDYLIFLNNRYNQEKQKTKDIRLAMQNAVKHSALPIIASSLTTIAGLVALVFMNYKIGFDLGLVLTKGILLSLLSVFVLTPPFMILLDKFIEKTKHKSFTIKTDKLAVFLKKTRFIIPALMMVVIVLSGVLQQKNVFQYGEDASMGGEGSRLYSDNAKIEESFGISNKLVILLPNEYAAKEAEIFTALSTNEKITSISCYSLLQMQAQQAGQTLPDSVTSQFLGKSYSRIILNIDVPEESEESTALINNIDSVISENAQDYYLLGKSASVLDLKSMSSYDYQIVSLISIGLVALILLFSFKSLLLPIILILVIQGSIWINMACSYLQNNPVIFIGYLIVSCIQLGATIDYGILLTSRYTENRKIYDKFTSANNALGESVFSIIISASILFTAGILLYFVSSMPAIALLGGLIARGALFSSVLVIFLLPQLLMLTDKAIKATTLNNNFAKDIKPNKK